MLIGKVLGPTEVEADGSRVDLGGPLPRRLVAALLAAEGGAVGEDTLAEIVWAGRPPAAAATSLQAYVSRLRRAFGGHRDALERSADGYRLRTGGTDADCFAAEVERGRRLLDDGRPAEARRTLDTALRRWRGDAYAELSDDGSAAPVRARLTELRAVAAEERLAALLAIGDAPGAVGELEAAVRAEPYRERRWELLILALYRSGRQAEALAALRRVRARLADDLGIDPGPALQDLEGRLLAQDPGLLLPSRPAPAVRPLSHFFGRSGELSALAELSAHARLVTLVGPGGAGKTRLAVEYAAARAPWFVRLADVADPALVPAAVAAAAGVRGASTEAIAAALGDRPGLLLLDNCEHVVAAAAELTLGLLARCPGLRVLATSREPLGVDGERLLPVTPLPAADAVALLTDRVTAVRPGWRPDAAESTTLAGLAAALDGIPLALELAAARARVLNLAELLDMLRDRFPALGPVPRGALAPHETLEAAVAWSVDLLSAHDRAVLLRLWPFEGGFPLSAVDDLDALSALVARSVVAADTSATPARYRLLEILRAYCRQHDPDPAGSAEQHAAWVRRLVDQHVGHLRGERSAHAIRVLNRELPNLRAGLAYDLAAHPTAALRTAGLLEWFWFRGGHVGEGLRLLRAALAGAPHAPPTDRARAWISAATLHFIGGDLEAAAQSLWTGLAVLGEPVDREGRVLRAQAAYYEALFRSAGGDFARAAEAARRSMTMARADGEDWIVPAATMSLGPALTGAGRVAQGRRVLARAAVRADAEHQNWTAAMSELLLARSLLIDGPDGSAARPPEALVVARRALRRFAEEDDVGNVLASLHTGAYALTLAGRPGDGATLLAAVRRTAARRGLSLDKTALLPDAALRAALRGVDLAAAERSAAGLDESALPALLEPPAGQD